MRFFAAVFAAIALAAPIFAGPASLRKVEKFDGETTGRYIVKLKNGASWTAVVGRSKANSNITHEWDLFNGFAGYFDDDTLNALCLSPDVEHISEDGIMHTFATQNNAPWGLARMSQPTPLTDQNPNDLNYSYSYGDSAGEGVDIYFLDTGIFFDHSDFGGRARWGATFGNYSSFDDNGHGTHVAGTAAGHRFGVAKKAEVIAVKVLSKSGSGSIADIMSGLDYVGDQADKTKRPSIASMSLGGSRNFLLDFATNELVSRKVHVVVAAGNDDRDAENTSPARVRSAITVGASTITDARASFSNYGAVVDVFAPGQNITSCWIRNATDYVSLSGTSMATPHVAGLVALLIGKDGNITPEVMAGRIVALSQKNALTGIPADTGNRLAQNGQTETF